MTLETPPQRISRHLPAEPHLVLLKGRHEVGTVGKAGRLAECHQEGQALGATQGAGVDQHGGQPGRRVTGLGFYFRKLSQATVRGQVQAQAQKWGPCSGGCCDFLAER